MRCDSQLRQDVRDELDWDPSVRADRIGVASIGGVVKLTGDSPTYAENMAAERLAKSIAGVMGVINDLEVRLSQVDWRSDREISGAAADAIRWRASLLVGNVQAAVRSGWITLKGCVDWQFQRREAHQAVCNLIGVQGIINRIELHLLPHSTDIKEKIEAAFRRRAWLADDHVRVGAESGAITLQGDVDSWSESSEAERIAWGAAGVTWVDNELNIGAASYG
ncbi:hypothetical protein PLANPX_1890 [Lacipirellula parvula]|uniref:BON domain-containing protein n=2 Tax=Lacipirellula parvula TaxID=2650471 RepID=A0A5K7X6V6_9BACT|nr:hypothetical protein PLANPX_1890 [Lacipirellula parvula]